MPGSYKTLQLAFDLVEVLPAKVEGISLTAIGKRDGVRGIDLSASGRLANHGTVAEATTANRAKVPSRRVQPEHAPGGGTTRHEARTRRLGSTGAWEQWVPAYGGMGARGYGHAGAALGYGRTGAA